MSIADNNVQIDNNEFVLSTEEKKQCLRQMAKKNRKILYVYERSLEPDSGYDYKEYLKGFVLYATTSNTLFRGGLVNVLINLHSILQNDLEYAEIKKLVYENANYLSYFLKKIKESE